MRSQARKISTWQNYIYVNTNFYSDASKKCVNPYNNRCWSFEVIRIIDAFNTGKDFEKVRKMLSVLKFLRQQAAVEAGISSPFAEDILYKRRHTLAKGCGFLCWKTTKMY